MLNGSLSRTFALHARRAVRARRGVIGVGASVLLPVVPLLVHLHHPSVVASVLFPVRFLIVISRVRSSLVGFLTLVASVQASTHALTVLTDSVASIVVRVMIIN